MDDHDERVTRLGPDSGGRRRRDDEPRTPGPDVRIHAWEWGPGGARRPGLPWIGIFLLVFGALLLVRQLFPEVRALGSLLVLAVGLAFLVRWAIDRGTGSLYAGAIITALAVPGLVEEATTEVDGLGTLSLGVAFLFIAGVRAATGGGWGWQAWFGGLLVLIGAVAMTTPGVGGLVLPVLLVILGAVLIVRGGIGRR